MSIKNRPYVGSWQLNNKTLVRHVPDAIVLINGYTELASCATCSKRIDMQKYISQVSCDASTDPISTANLSFKIPRHATELFDRDGNFILKPGLEVIIMFRGYFPMKDYAGRGQDPADGGFDADDVSVYPYYQCFRGVSTEVSHEYSGGFYSGSMSCSNLLHMWQNLKVSVNGAAFGKRPANSAVQPHLIGHRFTGANPYSVVYTLTKVGFGAAYGVEFVYAQSTNVAAKDDAGSESLYAHAAEWWERRWQEASGRLRMYGINGRIFNAFEQAYLGRWYDTRNRSKGVLAKSVKTVRELYKSANKDKNLLSYKEIKRALRELGYDRYSVAAGVYADSSGSIKASEDVLKMQAFTLDIGSMGSVNMFETEYVSKLDIVNTVCEITGFEFYQDVDGDLVFKPPMYNMDTRSDPVYVIKDRDLISIDESESEPEVTMVKGTGSHFSNISGHGIDGWAGVGALYIDYRLVAQFGYKEDSFESNYFSSKHALYLSAMNRLDLANIGMRSGSISIPMRPELRPGYPVYVESEDCFYYVKSLSHSFSFGGEATTSISWVAKRRKWMPPIKTPKNNKFPSMADVKLDAPGEYPSHPILVYPEDPEDSTPPRMIGLPNVIMALDPDKLNFDTVDLSQKTLTAEGFIEAALSSEFLERGEEENMFLLRRGNNDVQKIPLSEIQQQWSEVSEALSQGNVSDLPSSDIGFILSKMQESTGFLLGDIEDANNLVNYLAIQNSLLSQFSPGSQVSGRYRYFSCSHPDPRHQAPKNLRVDQQKQVVVNEEPEKSTSGRTIIQLVDREDGFGVTLKEVPATQVRGVKIKTLSNKAKEADKGEHKFALSSDINFVVFAPQSLVKKVLVSNISAKAKPRSNFKIPTANFKAAILSKIRRELYLTNQAETYGDRYSDTKEFIESAFISYQETFTETSNIKRKRQKLENYLESKIFKQTVKETRKGDITNIKKITAKLAGLYTNWLISIQNQGSKELRADKEKYDSFMLARLTFINTILGEDTIKDSTPGKSYTYIDNYSAQLYYTPIFPVSDAGGYELIGSLPYGRGLTVATYAALLQSDKQTTGGTPEEIALNTETTISSQGVNASDMGSVEEFLIAYIGSGKDFDSAFSVFDEAKKKAILAGTGTASPDQLSAQIEKLVSGDVSSKVKLRNNPVTSYSRGHSVFGDTAAVNLANLEIEGGVCNCKGADGAYFLQSMNQENIISFGEEAVFEEMRAQAEEKTKSWKDTKNAYAGTSTKRSRELSDTISKAIKDPSRVYGSLLSELSQAGQELGEQVEDIIEGDED